MKCRDECTRRDYLNKRSNQLLFNYLFLSTEHSSVNYFASSIIRTDVIEGLNDVISLLGTDVLDKTAGEEQWYCQMSDDLTFGHLLLTFSKNRDSFIWIRINDFSCWWINVPIQYLFILSDGQKNNNYVNKNAYDLFRY